MTPPFPRSYWVIPGKLLAGCYPGDLDPGQRDAKLGALLASGVTLVINLMEESESDHSGNPFDDYAPRLHEFVNSEKVVRTVRFAIRDQSIPSPALMQTILRAIDEEISANGVAYVHCWGGKGRTATAVGCYLVSRNIETHETVLARLRELTAHASKFFWPTPQTAEQCDFITSWSAR
jgi:hypothetical protein